MRNNVSNSSHVLIFFKSITIPCRFVYFKIALIVLVLPQPGYPQKNNPALNVHPRRVYFSSPLFVISDGLYINGVIYFIKSFFPSKKILLFKSLLCSELYLSKFNLIIPSSLIEFR